MKCSAHAFGTVLAFICIFLSTSCVTDYDTPETADGKMILNLRLDTSGMFTRSNDGSEVSNGMSETVDENYIDWEDVWIAAFDATSGKRIDVLYSLGARNDGNDGNKVSASVDVSEYSGDVRIVALANWSRYGIVISDLNKITDIKDLNDLTFSFTPDNLKNTESKTEYCPLPMFGSERIATGFPLAKEKDVSISMTRALAKIEIVDNLDGDVRIESATLCNYAQSGKVVPSGGAEEGIGSSAEAVGNATDGSESTVESLGRDLPFNKIEGESGKSTFYVYVPEISLGEASSDIRKIALKLSDGNNSEISLINYDENKQPSAEISDDWKSLKRNHIYRFNVNALISTEPQIEIQPTIRICWYVTSTGRFSSKKDHLIIFDKESSKPLNFKDYESRTSRNNENEYSIDSYYINIELSQYGLFDNLRYRIIEEEDLDYYNSVVYYTYLIHFLYKDVVKFENIEGITYCWLNNIPYSNFNDNGKYTTFKEGVPHRIYWSGEMGKNYTVDFTINKSYKGSLKQLEGTFPKYNSDRNLFFYDFITTGEIKTVDCEISSFNTFKIDPCSFSYEEIDGKDYYVYYMN